MNIIVDHLPNCRVSLQVEVPSGVVNQERSKLVNYFATQAKIPGFRPGKAPKSMIEKRFKSQIEEELRSELIRRGCKEGIEKEELDVLHISDVKDAEFHMDDTFTFTAEVQVAPEFSLPDYKGIPVEIKKVDVTDADIDHALHHLRMRMAKYEDVEGRELAKGDFAVITYSGSVDGTPLEEAVENAGNLAKGEDQWLNIEDEIFLPGFTEALIGMNIGDSREFDLEMDAEFAVEELREKALHYTVELKGIKERVLPELTDELLGGLQEGLTVEALREQEREQIEQQQQSEQHQDMTNQILEFLDKNVEFELPNDVVQDETQRQVHDIVNRSQMQGISEDMLVEQQDAIFQHASAQAAGSVKAGFILREIAEKEEIKAEQNEILGQIAQMAAAANMAPDKYFKQLQKDDGLSQVASRVVTRKTLDFLRENASVTEVDRPPHECDLDH